MAKIGHASLGSNRKVSGDVAGDQGKEVTTTSWYNKNWTYVLRPKNKDVAKKMAIACEKGCANNKIGYDQGQRNTLRTQAKANGMDLSKITVPCECDCSSFMTVCAECAGVAIPYNGSNAPTTSTMQKAFMSTGQFDLLTDSKYLTSDKYLKRGDIIVKTGSHTVMVLEDGSAVNNDNSELAPIPATVSTVNAKAVDISKHNVITDYKLLSQQIKYIMIRVGYRSSSTGALTEDSSFKQHITNCLANNMKVGIYFYDQSLNETEAIEQAVWTANMLKDYKISLPVFIDSENMKGNTGRADSLPKEQRTKNVIAFCEKIKELGYTPGVYSGNSWFTHQLEFDKLSKYIIWCARYSTTPPDIPRYDIWQYGSEYYSWAIKNIDSNIIYTDLKVSASTPMSAPTPTPTPTKVTKEQSILLMGKVNIISGTLNVRLTPSTDAPIVQQLNKGFYIQLRGDLGDWYRIDTGYVLKKYIKEAHGIVIGDNVRVRSNPDTSSTDNIVATLPKDTEVIICTAGGGWYYILLNDGTTGWIKGQYIKLK